jgi:acid phosphatase type 7
VLLSGGSAGAATGQTIVYALGDAADGSSTSTALANYVKAQNPDRFFYLGDVYETGTATEFNTRYEPLYGSIASKTDPVIGNHEYGNRSTGYYPYWQGKRGWSQTQALHRSYVDAASGWQIIAYSSEQSSMTTEGNWVAGEVAKHAGTCRIVMAHKGRHVVVDTSHNDNTNQETVWTKIVNKTAINLVGHNHVYGRLAPISGVHVFTSGAGGHDLRSLGSQHHTVANSKTLVATATRLVLRPGAADYQQVDKNGTVYDSGTITCTPA